MVISENTESFDSYIRIIKYWDFKIWDIIILMFGKTKRCNDMNKYSIAEFIKTTEQVDKGEGFFELETPRLLEVNLNGLVWAKAGSMVAYEGGIKFVREGILENGLGAMFKKAFTGEGASLMKANGQGKLYLADSGKKIIILHLQNDAIYVNGNDLLAFEPSIKHQIKLMRKVAGMMSGGLFNIRCEGTGLVAITSHYEPLTLRVTPGKPIITDPNATDFNDKKIKLQEQA